MSADPTLRSLPTGPAIPATPAGCSACGRAAAIRRAAALLAVAVLGLLTVGGFLAGPGAGVAAAQTGGTISSYDIELTLDPSGALHVREQLDYTLASNEQHGFRRFIPIEVDYDDQHRRLYRIDDVSVGAEPVDGQILSGSLQGANRLATNEDAGQFVIRIGDVGTIIDGTWRYTIEYTVHDTVETTDVRDVGTIEELAWNAVGTEWSRPLGTVRVHGTMPADPMASKCYTGTYGSAEQCSLSWNGSSFDVTVPDVRAHQAVTLYADFPPGTVTDATAVLEEKWSLARAFRATPVTLAGSALGTVAVLGGLGTLLGREGRDRRLVLNAYLPAEAEPDQQGLAGFFEKPDGPVQFRPPDGMTPGLCGVLTDEKADPLDVSATIVDLAVRGYLRIEQVGDGKGRHSDFNLRFLRGADESLNAYEQVLLGHLSSYGPEVRLSALRTKFATQLSEVRKAMYEETMRRHWFRRRPDRVRGMWIGIGIVALGLGGVLAAGLIAGTTFGLFALPLVLPGFLIVGSANKMPSRTALGRQQLELCVGYERFLEVADADELRFAEQQNAFIAGLPYAMVFGIADRWARVLATLQERGLDLAPTWYVPMYPGPFRYDDLGRSMTNFNAVAAAALSAPKPSSSTGGGFGGGGFGGGFSGGGGGGGGGGGW